MTQNPGRSTSQDQIDPMIDALIKELLETASPQEVAQKEDAITTALTEELMASLTPSERTISQASSFETAVFAAALAPALADALAPVLAENLTPAIVKAFNDIVSSTKTDKETASKKSVDKKEKE
jgi:hypothetical protein